jgi:uncharacterized protein (TIGR00288 family)
MNKDTIALYWDFENIHASLYDTKNGSGSYGRISNRNVQHEVLVDINAVYDFAASFGNVAINKAYCNWQWFSQYRHSLLKYAIELIQLFSPGASAKNGADIKLSLDAMEDIVRFPHISSIIIIAGDSDFIPLAQKIKAAGKDLIGVGCKGTTNQHWANSCSEFKYYETFAIEPQREEEESGTVVIKDAVELITRAIKQISARNGDEWVVKAAIRPIVKRLDPTFDEASYNCKTFSDLLKKHSDQFCIRPGKHDHVVSLVEHGRQANPPPGRNKGQRI